VNVQIRCFCFECGWDRSARLGLGFGFGFRNKTELTGDESVIPDMKVWC
jgi:hypothetical protein